MPKSTATSSRKGGSGSATPSAAEIIGHGKAERVAPRRERGRRQIGAAAVGVGRAPRDLAVRPAQRHRHARRGPAVHGVEDVGAEAGHAASSFSSRPPDQPQPADAAVGDDVQPHEADRRRGRPARRGRRGPCRPRASPRAAAPASSPTPPRSPRASRSRSGRRLEEAAVRIIAFEMGGVDDDLLDPPRRAQLQHRPVMARARAAAASPSRRPCSRRGRARSDSRCSHNARHWR